MVTDKTILRSAAFDVAVQAEPHIDLMHWHDAVHGFDRPVTFLARDPGPNMRLMHEPDEVRQRVDAVPANFERRLMVVGPRLGYRLQASEQCAAMTADTPLNRRYTGRLRSAGVLVAVLARNLVNSGMNSVTEGDRLCHIIARCPRTL